MYAAQQVNKDQYTSYIKQTKKKLCVKLYQQTILTLNNIYMTSKETISIKLKSTKLDLLKHFVS